MSRPLFPTAVVLVCSLLLRPLAAAPELAPAAIPANQAAIPPKPPAPVLYVAALRPDPQAPDSTGYGTATLVLATDEASARVAVSYSNLTSTPVSGHLKLGAPNEDGAYVRNFPAAQPAAFDWVFKDSGQLSITTGASGVVTAATFRNLYAYDVYNTQASVRFLQIYNKATAGVPGTDTPVMTIPVPATARAALALDVAWYSFANGISWAVTTDAAGATIGASGDVVGVFAFS